MVIDSLFFSLRLFSPHFDVLVKNEFFSYDIFGQICISERGAERISSIHGSARESAKLTMM
jgi:hypothetical protein